MLKPCPFCGESSAKLSYVRDGWKVMCDCGASAKSCFHGPPNMPSSEERATAAWNTRHDDPLVEVLVAALRDIAEATSAEDDAGENYRWDDREGALDYAYAVAKRGLAQWEKRNG